MQEESSCTPATPDACARNLGEIQLAAGDFVSAYRSFLPLADRGDVVAIARLVEICNRAGDPTRAGVWAARLVH